MEGGIEQRPLGAVVPQLKEIPDAPQRLYLRGTLPPEGHKLLCVVGSRKYTPYGKAVCGRLIQGLSQMPISIVSGLALGIDGIAHEAALAAGLHTIAVPGSGLSDAALYPRTHINLAQRILKSGGALLSEFEPDYRPQPYDFIKRNRIMAGLSHAVLVIEADQRSGTLTTARLAMDYNRDVLAVPGPLTSSTSEGPHMLIRDGAALIRNPDDILEVLGLSRQSKTDTLEVTAAEAALLDVLRAPRGRAEVMEALNLPAHEVNILISTLEIKGVIVEELGLLRRR